MTCKQESDTGHALEEPVPLHRAEDLMDGGQIAKILLSGQTYVLRITRAGKLILTK
jgi:hemin uptake protein HemP